MPALRPSASGLVAATMLAMLPVLGFGLWRSGMLAQDLWSPLLVRQALVVLGVAACGTAVALHAVPRPWRGWPALCALAGLGAAAALGIGASLAAGLIVLCCLVAGQALLLAAGQPDRTDPVLCATTGLGAIMLLLVAAGLVHLPTGPACLLIPAACLGALGLSPRLRSSLRAAIAGGPAAPAEPWPLSRAVVAGLILAALLYYAANAALPERFYDPLTMHLMIPTQALTFGHWSHDAARFSLAYFPIGADQLFALGLALGGEPAAKAVNLLALAGILLLLHAIIRPMAGARLAELALLLLLSLPLTLLLATTAMVEMLLALHILAATRAVLLLRSERPSAPLVALAVLLPAMAAIKLHGVVAAIPLLALALVPLRRQLRPLATTGLLLTATLAAAAGAAPYAYAWLRTGNPVFPLLNDIFRSPLWPATRFEDLRWQGHFSWRLLYRMTFDSRSYLEADNGAIGVTLMLLLLPGIAATLLVPRRTPLVALAVAAVSIAAIAPSVQYIRYLYPVVPLLLIVCAHGLATLPRAAAALGAAIPALSVGLGIALLPSAGWVLKTADLRAAFDPAARHAMLAAQAPTRLAVETVNAIGGPKPRVLFGGEPYGAFLRGTFLYAAWYDRTLNAALYAAADPAAVATILAAERPDYAIAVPDSADPIERKVATWAAAHGTRIPQAGPVGLWRITAPGSP